MSAADIVGEGPSIVHYALSLPDGRWAAWSPGTGISETAQRLATELGSSAASRQVVRRSIELINGDSLRKGDHILQNAVWVPSRSTGEVAAVLDLVLIAAPGGADAPERHLARNLRRDFGWTTRIVEYAADTSQVPAGAMTIEQVLLRRFGERQVQAYLFLNVFPPGADEAASLVLNTVHLDLVTEVARQGRMIAESLQLTLGDIPGGRPSR